METFFLLLAAFVGASYVYEKGDDPNIRLVARGVQFGILFAGFAAVLLFVLWFVIIA